MKQRWLRIVVLGLVLFAVNVIARVIARILDPNVDPLNPASGAAQVVAYVGLGVVFVLMVSAGAWWAIRHPFSRVFFDLAGATLIFTVLSLFVGPLFVGQSPFKNDLAFFVLQFLLMLALGLAGALLGFAGAVATGKDWKSQGLRQFEQARQRRITRSARRIQG